MKKYLFVFGIALTITFTYSNLSFAACGGGPTVFTCDTSAPNPDLDGIQEQANDDNLTIEMLEGSEIDTRLASGGNGLPGIRTGNGSNVITINNATINSQLETIELQDGEVNLNITDSELFNLNFNTIQIGDANHIVNILRSTITNIDGRVLSISGDAIHTNTITIIDSEIKTLDTQGRAYNGSNGVDNMFIENTIMQGGTGGLIPDTIDLAAGDDVLTLGNGVDIRGLTPVGQGPGLMDCGGGFDTIVFAMDVPIELLPQISAELVAADPAEGSITINGLFYTWIDCELLVNELNGVQNIRPIPTISQWGLMIMAGVLGLIGFIAAHRRKSAA